MSPIRKKREKGETTLRLALGYVTKLHKKRTLPPNKKSQKILKSGSKTKEEVNGEAKTCSQITCSRIILTRSE